MTGPGAVVLEFVGVCLAGLLAGEEFVVRYGVQPALAGLAGPDQTRARQSLIRRLRVLVPILMGLTVVSGVAVLVLGGSGPGLGFRWAGVLALAAFVLVTFAGTVPINQRIGGWDPDALPADWREVVRRWERLDVVRSSAAVLAFGFFLVAMALQLPSS